METHLQQLLDFYEREISNSRLFSKEQIHASIYLFLLIVFLFVTILNKNTFIYNVVLAIVTITTIISLFHLIYKLQKRLGNLNELTFKKGFFECIIAIINTKFLLSLNDSKFLRKEKLSKLREYFKEKEFYNEKHLKVFMDVLEKEYQNRFGNISWLSLLISILIPLCIYFIQTMFNFRDVKFDINDNEHIFTLKIIFITIVMIVCIGYVFVRYIVAALKATFLLIFPIRKYEVLDLTSLIRELYLECYIEEKQDQEILTVKGFIRKE